MEQFEVCWVDLNSFTWFKLASSWNLMFQYLEDGWATVVAETEASHGKGEKHLIEFIILNNTTASLNS